MADYFTNFSFIVPLPDEAAQKYALELHFQASAAQRGDELVGDFPASLANWAEDWCFDADTETSEGKWGVWLHSSSGGIDAVCAFVQHLLRRFDPKGAVTFEWSHDCSKPRTDAYGGGAAFITARKIKTMSTADWLHKNTAARAQNQLPKGETTR